MQPAEPSEPRGLSSLQHALRSCGISHTGRIPLSTQLETWDFVVQGYSRWLCQVLVTKTTAAPTAERKNVAGSQGLQHLTCEQHRRAFSDVKSPAWAPEEKSTNILALRCGPVLCCLQRAVAVFRSK